MYQFKRSEILNLSTFCIRAAGLEYQNLLHDFLNSLKKSSVIRNDSNYLMNNRREVCVIFRVQEVQLKTPNNQTVHHILI